MASVYHPPSNKTDYDHKRAKNNERAYLLNNYLETILTGDFNLDYSQKNLNKHHLVKEVKDSKFIQLVSYYAPHL